MARVQCACFFRLIPGDAKPVDVANAVTALNAEANSFLMTISAEHFHWLTLAGCQQHDNTLVMVSVDYIRDDL